MNLKRILTLLALLVPLVCCRADYIEFTVALSGSDTSADSSAPLLRDIRACIAAPDGTLHVYPAFHYKDSSWKIRVRPTLLGQWKLCEVREYTDDAKTSHALTLAPDSFPQQRTCDRANLSNVSPVGIDPRNARGFAYDDARPYYPFGINLGWSTNNLTFETAFASMQKAGLNWTRIWMAHWDTMNLDWLPEYTKRASPKPGNVDEEPARNWDAVIALAEKQNIYVQPVLQHHGQYSLSHNSNWDINPWNKANGGFLETPTDFFTSREAIRYTKAKYRYIIARYGHSPAILAWELFNEVHWTTPTMQGRDDILGAWHAEMAAYIRATDPYHHLVTTSHDDLRSSVYTTLDFFQPHIYAVNMQAAVRRYNFLPPAPVRPVFYGETGDEHMLLDKTQLASGETLVRLLWPSLFAGNGALPGQTWFWDKILPNPALLSEMRAISTYITAAKLPERSRTMSAFSPVINSAQTTPRIITAGHSWALTSATSVRIPDDNRDTPALADIPRFFISDPRYLAFGFKRAFDITFTKSTDAAAPVTIALTDVGNEGGSLRILVDGKPAHAYAWEPRSSGSELVPYSISLPVPAGKHTLTLENTGDPTSGRIASFRLGTIDLGDTQTALAACGLRSPESDVVLLYVWHRGNIFAETKNLGAAVSGEILLENISSGEWTATWWNMEEGGPALHKNIVHPGGDLKFHVPEILRHAALILEKK